MSRIVLDARKLADFGIGTYIRGLLLGLAAVDREHEYHLLGDPAGLSALSLPERFRPVAESADGYSLRELRSVSRAARRLGADLLHVPHYVVPLRPPCPVVTTIHDLIHLRFPELRTPLERLYARTMLGRAVRRSRRVVAVSRTTRDELVERLGAPPDRIVVVPNGVDDRFRRRLPASEVAAALATVGLAPGYLLFVGNPKPHKNLDLLLAAHRQLRRQPGSAPLLVVAGDPGSVPAATESVRRLGRVADDLLPALYQGAAITVVPSRWEGFGLPALEAMAGGTPVVAARAGALPEVIGEAGVLVEPDDAGALASALRALLDDPERRAELARRGPERAAGFRWQETARATLDVYRQAQEPAAEGRS